MFFDIYEDLCKKRGISCKQAAINMGISHGSPSKWKQRGSTPNGETLKKIAEYFGVTTSYLLEEGKKESPSFPAEPNKEELLKLIQNMSQDEAKKMLAVARAMFGDKL